jgi:hypothetical protein
VRGELDRLGLAEHDGAGGAQRGDARRVGGRAAAGEDRAAVLSRPVGRVDHVLDPDRHAVQRPARRLGVALARLRKGGGRIEVRPRLDGLLALGDPLEARGDERLRRQLPGGDAPRRLGRAEPPERLPGCRGRPAHRLSP